MIARKDGKIGILNILELREDGHDFGHELVVDVTRGLQTIDDDAVREKCKRAQEIISEILGVLTAQLAPDVDDDNFEEWQSIGQLLNEAYGARCYIREVMLREAGHGAEMDALIDELDATIALGESDTAQIH